MKHTFHSLLNSIDLSASFHQSFFEIIDIDTLDAREVQVSDVLKTVVRELTADFFVHGNSGLQASEVDVAKGFRNVQVEVGGESFEVVVESFDGFEFTSKGGEGFFRSEVGVLVLEIVELDHSGVNEGRVLASSVFRDSLSLVSLEVSDNFFSNLQITVLLDVGLGGCLQDDVELFLEGFLGGVNGFEVFQEVDRVQITQARSDGLGVDTIVGGAVSGPRAFFTIGSSGGVDLDVVSEEVFEHGARFAGFDVNDHFTVLLVVAHVLQSSNEVIGIEVFGGESNKTSGTVIREVDEDVVVLGALEDLLALGGSGISFEDGQEVGGGDISSLIVDLNTSIDVLTGLQQTGLVKDLAGEGVLLVVSDIIISHSDDVFFRNAIALQELVSMEDIRLMSVVPVSIGTSDKDCVLGSLSAEDGKAEDSKS